VGIKEAGGDVAASEFFAILLVSQRDLLSMLHNLVFVGAILLLMQVQIPPT
jgi:hypothetical protein